jgi:hypothetical protein
MRVMGSVPPASAGDVVEGVPEAFVVALSEALLVDGLDVVWFAEVELLVVESGQKMGTKARVLLLTVPSC